MENRMFLAQQTFDVLN